MTKMMSTCFSLHFYRLFHIKMTDSEDNCYLTWNRPNDVPYPNVWHVYEAVSKEGIKYKIKIQDIPLDRSSEAIDFMETYFDYNEPITR